MRIYEVTAKLVEIRKCIHQEICDYEKDEDVLTGYLDDANGFIDEAILSIQNYRKETSDHG